MAFSSVVVLSVASVAGALLSAFVALSILLCLQRRRLRSVECVQWDGKSSGAELGISVRTPIDRARTSARPESHPPRTSSNGIAT